jgi:hypothetical protein
MYDIQSTDRVSEVAVPAAAKALSTLSNVDYEDGFLVDAVPAQDRTAEEWARAILEDAPATTRRALRSGWCSLGLRLGSTRDERRVLGWEVRRSNPAFVLLGARSYIGFEGEVLVKREQDALLFSTFVQLKNPLARALWARVAPGHRRVVRSILEQCEAIKPAAGVRV